MFEFVGGVVVWLVVVSKGKFTLFYGKKEQFAQSCHHFSHILNLFYGKGGKK